ncbi:MAG: hypothetical protein WDM79_07510 [Terricaulis sp.]
MRWATAFVICCALFLASCTAVLAPDSSEAGFERWLGADAARGEAFARFESRLRDAGVGDVVANYQLWRVDRIAPRCIQAPYAIPPENTWANIVPALRFLRDHVKPEIGEVEVVSAYRDPDFNACVHGAPQSAHQSFFAMDLVPVDWRVGREDLIASLCSVHARVGRRARIGLGIYHARRFHIDARSFRGWGDNHHAATFPCAANPA